MLSTDSILYCENIDQLKLTGSALINTDPVKIWSLDMKLYSPHVKWLMNHLNDQELDRAARFYQISDANQYIVTRAILKILLAGRLSCKPSEINVISGQNKKPELLEPSSIHFNVSHAHQHAVIAITNQRVGIDLEYINEGFDYKIVAEHACSATELDYIDNSLFPLQEFFRIWTRKEAFLKGIGTGLINELKLLSCLNEANVLPPQFKRIAENWNVKTATLNQQYIMSIALESSCQITEVNLLPVNELLKY